MNKELNIKSMNLNNLINGFNRHNILVIGDIMLDQFIWGKVSRLSQEAPVPIVDVKKVSTMLGGAANVVNNITSLGGKAVLCGIVNFDAAGRNIISDLRNIDPEIVKGIVIDHSRPTTVKTRIIAKDQQVVRYDIEKRSPLETNITSDIIDFIGKQIESTNLVIVSDYGKGVISSKTMKYIQKLCFSADVPLIIDPNIDNFSLYSGALAVVPNHYEAMIMANNGRNMLTIGEALRNKLNCKNLLITRGKRGVSLFQENKEVVHIKSIAKKIYDVTGAGDTLVSVLGLCLGSSLDIESSSVLANIAAGIVVGEVGTSIIDLNKFKKIVEMRILKRRF